MSILEKIRKKAELLPTKRSKSFSLHISMPFLVFGILVLAVTLGWSFFMGFLVGRGEDPATRLNSLPIFGGGTKPEVREKPKEKPVMAEEEKLEKGSNADSQDDSPKDQALNKQDEALESPKPKAKPPHPFTRPKDQSLDAWGKKNQTQESRVNNPKETREDKLKEKVAKEKERDKDRENRSKEPKIEIRYQVASFVREVDAINLSKRCNQRGAQAIPQRFGKVFRVVITFRGVRQDIQDFKAKCKGLGIKDWLVISSRNLSEPSPKNPSKNEKGR